MKLSRLAPFAMFLFVPFVGCSCGGGDGGDEGASGSSDSSGTDGGSGTSSSTTSMSATTAGEGSGESAGTVDGTGSSSGGGGGEVTVSGVVHDYFGGPGNPVPDAEVSAYGIPGVTATTDAGGAFTLGPVPADSEIAIVIAPSTDYMGGVFPYTTGPDDDTGAEIPQISRATVQMQMDGIADQMPATPDLMQAIMIVGSRPLDSSVIDAVIDVVPDPPSDTYYAPDDMGAPVLGEHTIAFTTLPVVVYFNVAETMPGDIAITAMNPLDTCGILHPEFPTIGEHVTFVLVEC